MTTVSLLAGASGNQTGTLFDAGIPQSSVNLIVAVSGSPSYSVQLQCSADGRTWSSTGSAVTSAGTTTLSPAARYFRAALSGYSGPGSVTVDLGYTPAPGFNGLDGRYLQQAGGTMTGALTLQVPNIVFDGDSKTYGVGAVPLGGFPLSSDYPSQVVAALDRRGTYRNVGVPGEAVATMTTNAATAVDSHLVTGANNVVCFNGGNNDICYGANDTTTYSRIVTYCQARRAAGWKVIVGTITPCTSTGTPANQDTYRLSVNSQIRANWATFADGLADVGADPAMGTLGQETNTQYYNGDNVHPNPNGYRVYASYYLAALAKLGITGHQHGDRSGLISDLFIPASQFSLSLGSPSLATVGSAATWQLHHGTNDQVACVTTVPQDWLSFSVSAMWTMTAGASGNAEIYGGYVPVNSGSLLNSTPTYPYVAYVAKPGTIYQPQFTLMFSLNNIAGGYPSRNLYNFVIFRFGTDSGDTMTGDTYDLAGLYLQRTA